MVEPGVLAATLQAVSDAVLITAPDGAICWTNAAFTAMTGYTPDEVTGKSAFHSELWSTLLSGDAWTGEMTNCRKDGSVYIERQTITPVKDAGGAITHFIAVKRDITGERRLDLLYENVPAPYQSLDAAGCLIEVNRAWLELLGYQRGEVLGRSFADFLAPSQTALFEQRFAAFKATGRMCAVEFDMLRSDGAPVRVSASGIAAHNPDGTFRQTYCILHDIGERQRAREEREAILRTALDGFVIVDGAGRILETNDAYCRLTGYTRDELLRMRVHDLEAAETAEETDAHLPRIAHIGFDRFETRHRRKDGAIVDLDVSLNYLAPWEKYFVFLRDITERKRAERALRASEERYRTLVDSLIEGIVVRNREGVAITCNASAVRILGVPAESLLGPLRGCEFLDADGAPCLGGEEPSAITLRTGRPCSDVILGVRRPDAEVRWLQVNTSPIFGEDPAAPEAVVVSYLDVTERHRSAAALRDSEANYRNLFEQMPEGCAIHELAGTGDAAAYRFLAVNPAFERLTGLGAEAVTGRSLREVLPQMEREWAEIYERVALTGKPVHFERYFPALGKHFEAIAWRPDERRFATILADITEQRETAARLRESEARYRDMVETAWEGVWQIDAEHRTTFVNRRMADMLGCTREEMTGRPVTDFVAEALLAGAPAALDGMRAEQVEPRDCQLRRKDGADLWVMVSPTASYDAAGRYTGAIAMVADITERRRAERELEFERAQLLSIFDAMEDPVYVSDPQTHEVLFVNRSLRASLGRDPVGGKCYRELQRRDEPCDFCTNPIVFTDGGKSYRWRFDNPVLGRTYELTEQVIRWPDGRDVRLEFASDVTEGVRAEARLRDAHHLLDTLVQAAPVAIVALDAERRVRMWNRGAELISGWTAEEVVGRTLPAPARPERDAAIERVLAGETLPGIEFTTSRRDGFAFHVSASAAPLRDAAGRVVGLVIIATDMSDRKRLEAQLLQAQKLEGVGRLAGGVAHDFNNLLTIINGHADLIMMHIEDRRDPLYENAAEIKAAGDRAAGLTRQLLTFSRKQVMQPCLLDLNAIVNEVLRMLRRLIGEDIEVVTALSSCLGRVKADPGLLHQALINLAVNARDAMPEGGRLTIETGQLELAAAEGALDAGHYVTLTVSDTGVGMNEDTKIHLFEPFFTTKPAGRGTGLGLSTVYGVVKQSGGHIFVTSEPGKGSTFRICLPWAAAPEAALPQAPANAAADARGHETVLVVEDQAEVRRLVSSALGSFGYRVLEAAGGPEALALSERHAGRIDLLLADVVMPGMSGKEVAQNLAPLRPGMKVLFMSGYAEDVIAHHGALEPGVAYIAKPFTPAALAAKVRSVLGVREGPRRILVVDDDTAVRTLLCVILRGAGYDVAEAADGRQALTAVEAFNPHIVLMDLVMPEQEGIETIRTLSQRHTELKIIAMSGAFAGPLLEGTVYLGAHATLAKPITPDALLETIRTLE